MDLYECDYMCEAEAEGERIEYEKGNPKEKQSIHAFVPSHISLCALMPFCVREREQGAL